MSPTAHLRAHELFARLSTDRALELLAWLRQERRPMYQNTITLLAQQRKLRPVFVQKKPTKEQIAWLHKNLQRVSSEDAAMHLLQLWILSEHKEMLICFLEAMEIDHDGEGGVEQLPENLDAQKLDAAIAELLERFEPELVRLYLHVFAAQRVGGWDSLNQALSERSELHWQ